jgi:hypothetical protein
MKIVRSLLPVFIALALTWALFLLEPRITNEHRGGITTVKISSRQFLPDRHDPRL